MSNYEFNIAHIIHGFTMDFYGVERVGYNSVLTYCYRFDTEEKYRKATLQLCEWAKYLHGNAPSGTRYGYYKITLPNGKRVNYNVYV